MKRQARASSPAFAPDRFFWAASIGIKAGWYYEAREGLQGPFDTRSEAAENLQSLIEAFPHSRRDYIWAYRSA